MSRAKGFSLVEILVALTLLSLLLVPLSSLMSQSTTRTKVPLHEQMAVKYVRELLEQIAGIARNDFGPRVEGLVQEAGKPLSQLLTALNTELSVRHPGRFQILPIGQSSQRLMLSPLVEPFQERFLKVRQVDAANFSALENVKVHQVTAGVRWLTTTGAGGRPPRTYQASIFLVEGL